MMEGVGGVNFSSGEKWFGIEFDCIAWEEIEYFGGDFFSSLVLGFWGFLWLV